MTTTKAYARDKENSLGAVSAFSQIEGQVMVLLVDEDVVGVLRQATQAAAQRRFHRFAHKLRAVNCQRDTGVVKFDGAVELSKHAVNARCDGFAFRIWG